MKIFISGTTRDFESDRLRLRDVLDGFGQLDLTPIVQENLNEDVSHDANLVRKLIEAVRGCEMFLGLVGPAGGYPHPEDERRTVQQLAEKYLREQLRLAPSRLWREWADRGMTYTQLEVFLATSVFKKRVRLYFRKPPMGAVIEDHQRFYCEYLLRHRHTVEMIRLAEGAPWAEWKVDALRLVVDYVLQQRSAIAPISWDVPAREALRQRFQLVHEEDERECLKSDSFKAFYEEVRGRFTEALPVLARSCPREPLAANRVGGRPALVVQQDASFSVAVRYTSCILALRFDSRSGTVISKRRYDVDQDAYPISMLPDGEALLVMKGGSGQLLIGDRPPRSVAIPPLDAFARLPAMIESRGQYWLAIPQADERSEWHCLNPDTGSTAPPEQLVSYPDLHYFERIAVAVTRDATHKPLTLPIAQPALQLKPGMALALYAGEKPESVEMLELREYRAVQVGELFRVAETTVDSGHFVSMRVECQADRLAWVVDFNRAEGVTGEERIDLGCVSAEDVAPQVSHPAGLAYSGNGTIAAQTGMDRMPTLPFAAKYSWTTNGEFLLAIQSRETGFVAHAWRFPRPVERGDFVSSLWELMNGLRPFSPSEELTWRTILKKPRLIATD